MDDERKQRQGPITLLLGNRRMQRSLFVAVAGLVLYLASSGPARSILIREKLLDVRRETDGSLIYTTRIEDVWWRLIYAPLNLCRDGTAGSVLRNYWALFPTQSELPADLR